MVTEITSLKQFQDAIAQDGLVVVDFHATWCNPCKAVAPIVEKLSEQYSKDHFYKIDVDAVPDVSAENEISAMPTILLFKKGERIDAIIGANVEKIKTLISQNATA